VPPTQEKIQWIRDGAGGRFDELELEIGAYFVSVTNDPVSAADAIGSRFGVDGAAILSHPHALIGSVDAICDTLCERRERSGISYITVAQRNAEDMAPVVARLAGT
jgi:hypothetical protein